MSEETRRIDQWLFFARFFKTRSLAAQRVQAGAVRLNGERVSKPARQVRAGDALTFAQGPHIRVVKIRALGARRGPAPEAQELYEDLAPPAPPQSKPPEAAEPARRAPGAGRPSKRERRALARFRDEGAGR